jgi:hypothetical protein
MFREALTDLYALQRQRLNIVVNDTDKVDRAFEALVELGLTLEQVDQKCCAELKTILNKRYEDPIPNGTRLQGHGWTRAHVEDHMNRYLTKLLQDVNVHLRTLLVSNEDHREHETPSPQPEEAHPMDHTE